MYPENRAPDKSGTEDNSKIVFLISQQKHVITYYPSLETSQQGSSNDRL